MCDVPTARRRWRGRSSAARNMQSGLSKEKLENHRFVIGPVSTRPGSAPVRSQSSDDTSASVRPLDLLLTPNVAPPSNSKILRLILPRRRSLDAAGGHDICEAGAAPNLVKRSGGDEVRDILRVSRLRGVGNASP